MKMDELFMNVGNIHFLLKIEPKKKVENIYVGLF
jgi:hypothetical protein